MNNLTHELVDLFYHLNKKRLSIMHREELSAIKVSVLFYLLKNKVEYLNPKDLCNILNLSKSSITSILNDLEQLEYIERSIDANDRRKIKIEIKEKGKNLLKSKNDILHAHINYFIDKVGEDDTKELIRIVNKFMKEEKDV